MEQDLTYDKAYTELKSIAQEIDSESITVDVLAERVKRAADLIKFCQDKLRATETEVDNIIKQMESSSPASS